MLSFILHRYCHLEAITLQHVCCAIVAEAITVVIASHIFAASADADIVAVDAFVTGFMPNNLPYKRMQI